MEQRHKYLEILRIEVDDLAEDIKALQKHYHDRLARGEITDYVLRENVAVLEHESHGIAAVRACLEDLRPADYASLEDMIAAIGGRLDDRLRCGGFDPVVRLLVERKLAKVERYVRQDLPLRPR